MVTDITEKLKLKNSSDSDKTRTDVFKIDPGLFADSTIELWPVMGRARYIPEMFKSSLLASIYK